MSVNDSSVNDSSVNESSGNRPTVKESNDPTLDETRVGFGTIFVHGVTLDQAAEIIVQRAQSGLGGYVVTPNVDHICIAEETERFRRACNGAFLSVADGQPLLWMARARKQRVPQKVSGSDLVIPLLHKAAAANLRVFFVGATEEVCAIAAQRLRHDIAGLDIVGWTSPTVNIDNIAAGLIDTFSELDRTRPHIVLFAFGAPKQEYAMSECLASYFPAVGLGIGATLDFVAGKVERAPKWWSDHGLEWLFRLYKEPKRLWRRYLVRDRAILRIFLRDLRANRKTVRHRL